MSVGVTFGAWDLLHAGHVHFLRSCQAKCDVLIVGLHVNPSIERPDTKETPVQSVLERYWQVQPYSDAVIPYETEADLQNILAMVQPLDYYFLGSDYMHKQLPDRVMQICSELEITISYIPRLHTYSSTDLRKRIRDKNDQTKNKD